VIRIMRNDRNAGKVDIPKLRVRPDPKPKGEPRLLADGTIEYHPQLGATGTDSFQYDYCGGPSVNSAGQRCQPATVTITVKPRPVPPGIDSVASNPTPPNHEVTVTGTTGTCDPAARLTLDSRPKAAAPVAVTGGQDGAFEAKLKVPPGTFVDPYRLRLRVVCDGKTEVVDRELRVANQPPTPVDDPATTTEGNPVTIDVTANDTDPDGDDGYDTSLKPAKPGRGRLDVKPGKPLVYTPENGFIGVDRFTYRLCEVVDAAGAEDCGTATVTVTVGPRIPVPVDDPDVKTVRDQAVVADVMRNDRDPDPSRLQARQPARPGAKTEQQADGTVRYIPEEGFTGVDTFQYDYCAGSGGATAAQGTCPFATVTVTVNPPKPVPVDDPDETTLRDRPAALDVMENDRDPDPTRLRVLERPAPEGTAVVQPDGSIRYTPAAGAVGDDRFRYDYCGGSAGVTAAQGPCPSATVTVAVTDVPVISSVEPAATPPGKPVKVVGNTGSCNPSGTLGLRGAGVTATATADPDGAFTTTLTVPAGTFPRLYRLELRVDCGGRTQRAEAPLTVTNQAPVPADDLESTTRDQAVKIDVTKSDRDPDDPDGYPTLVLVTRGPDHGSAQEQGESVLYTPAPGFVGTDQFDYSLCDNMLNAANQADCGTATVTINVTDVPAISSVEPGSTPPGRPVLVAGSTGSCERAGTLIFSGATDRPMEVTGDQNGGFAVTLTVPEGTFPNRYRLELVVDCNGQPQRAEAALTVANQAPVAVDDEVSIAPDADTTIDVTRNDHDPDDPDTYQTLVVVTDVPDHGSAQEQGLSVRYTPEPGFVGTDQFEYALCDDVVNATGEADCGRATVAVRVGPPPCAPTGTGDPGLRAEPSRGPGGTMLHITATVDRKLATCQFRLLLGGTTLAPDVTVGDDGSITADRGVPGNATPGPNAMRLATLTALTVDETPFEVLPEPPPPTPSPNWPRRLALSAGALLAGFLARAAFRRWLKPDGERSKHRDVEPPDGLQARPHPRSGETSVAPVADGTHPSSLRLEPHFDPGVQTVDIVEEEEVTR
jgi:large repetitive protein